eukprot:scaffold245387_cov18-Tisochrysis_lutea.AAC.2
MRGTLRIYPETGSKRKFAQDTENPVQSSDRTSLCTITIRQSISTHGIIIRPSRQVCCLVASGGDVRCCGWVRQRSFRCVLQVTLLRTTRLRLSSAGVMYVSKGRGSSKDAELSASPISELTALSPAHPQNRGGE